MVDWGSVAEWVGAVGTGGAMLVAAVAYRKDVWHRERAQARLVTVVFHESAEPETLVPGRRSERAARLGREIVGDIRVGKDRNFEPEFHGWIYGIGVQNASDELVPEVRLRIGDDVFLPPGGGAVAAGKDLAIGYTSQKHLYFVPSIEFKDSTGRWWRRSWVEPVERARDLDALERKRRRELDRDVKRMKGKG